MNQSLISMSVGTRLAAIVGVIILVFVMLWVAA